MHIQRLWVLLAMSAVLRQVFPFFWSTFTVKIAVSLHSTHFLTSLMVQNLPRPKVFGGRWSRVLEGLISSSLQVARLLLKNTLRGFFLCFRHGLPRVNGEQGMARWWERSPPTNVARVQIPASTPNVGWVCCWFSPLLREVFLRVLRFPPLLKNQHFHMISQFDQESCRRRTTLWMCYLHIIIYSSIYYYLLEADLLLKEEQ